MPAPVNPNRSELDQQQILQRAFDESTDRLRTDGTFTGTIIGEVSVEIDAADGDNIALSNSDGSKKVTVTTVGSKEALDIRVADGSVNVSNTLITEPFDYIAATYPSGTQEVYTYKLGGSGGTIVGIITVNYTDATKNTLSDVSVT